MPQRELERAGRGARDLAGRALQPGGLRSRRRDRREPVELSGALDEGQRLVERRPALQVPAPRLHEADDHQQ
jgi:hypothetical protein